MNPETPSPAAAQNAAADDWQSAIADFAASRIELIRLESKDATRNAAQKLREAVLLIGAGMLGWICLLAGLIGAIHHYTPWPWWYGALLLGVIHALFAVRYAILLKRAGAPAFPLTRAEFQKDRLWMQSLKKPKSKL